MGEWIGLALWLIIAAGAPAGLVLDRDAGKLWPRPWENETVFHVGRRAVSNWRQESTRWIATANSSWPQTRLGLALVDGAALPRCVRLNNYWCVKRAGWSGEIAADAEGHVAFSSALEGATVAALLLRRYYVDLKLVSARDVVSRWAPPQCGPPAPLVAAVPKEQLAKVAAFRRKVATQQRASAARGRTLRAQWLARNRPGFTGPRYASRKGLRRSVVRDAPAPTLRAPAIAVGGGEIAASASALRVASLDLSAYMSSARLPAVTAPLPSCASETQRIDNYAARLASGLAARPGDDLALFDAQGEPTPALARALLNMAAVEIGPYAATPALADEAVEQLRLIVRLRREEAARQEAAKQDAARKAAEEAASSGASGQAPAP